MYESITQGGDLLLNVILRCRIVSDSLCVSIESALELQKIHVFSQKMIHEFLSVKLNADLADTIVNLSAVMAIQAYARGMLAKREAEDRRTSGEYAFHHVMEGKVINVWMSHDALIQHIKSGFVNVPVSYVLTSHTSPDENSAQVMSG